MIPEPDICESHHGGNEQSQGAHASIKHRARSIREVIRAYIKMYPGSTCEEIENELGLKHQTVSARVSELKRDGDIQIVGMRRISSGCEAARYRVTPKQLLLVVGVNG